MSEQPLLSVVLATRNCKPELEHTLTQLLLQRETVPFEILIADAQSTDGTAQLIAQHAAHLHWWVSEADAGIYDAWNKCLAHARGKWIAFLGAGDTYTPDGLARLAEAARQNPEVHYLACDQWQVHTDGSVMRRKNAKWQAQAFAKRMTLTHVGCWHARHAFETNGLFDTSYRICADYDWLLRMGPALRVVHVATPCVNMLVGGLSDANSLVFEETARAQQAHTRLPKWQIHLLKREAMLRKKIRRWLM